MRWKLILPAAAATLGIAILVAHFRQPPLPALPGRGCISTSFLRPESRLMMPPRVELEACIHISETIFNLTYYDMDTGEYSVLFEATGPEGPDRWADHIHIAWVGPDTIAVTYDKTIRPTRADKRSEGPRVTYSQVAALGG